MKMILRGLQLFFIAVVLVVFTGMSDCGDSRKVNMSGDPNFVALKEGQGLYEAIIKDELSRIEIKEVSFSGTTKVGGILYEDNDAAGSLDIDGLVGKTIRVVEDNYRSVRYPDKQLFKALVMEDSNLKEPKSISSLKDVKILGIEKVTGKTLFKAKILDGKDISVFKDAEFTGVDKKTGKTLFAAKVVEISENKNLADKELDEDQRFILIPRDIVICGIDKKTGASMAWLMRKIDSIEFKKPDVSESPEASIDAKFKKVLHKVGSKK